MKLRYLAYLPLFVAIGWGQSAPVLPGKTLTFAPVGVATSETVQINVANNASNTSAVAASCSGTISFNVAGAKNPPAAVAFTVTAGKIFSTSIAWTGLEVSARSEVVGSVQLIQEVATPCSLAVSLETYDTATGATHSYQANPSQSFPVAASVFGGVH